MFVNDRCVFERQFCEEVPILHRVCQPFVTVAFQPYCAKTLQEVLINFALNACLMPPNHLETENEGTQIYVWMCQKPFELIQFFLTETIFPMFLDVALEVCGS